MGHLERDIKKKIKKNNKSFENWYSENEEKISQIVQKNTVDTDIGLGEVKVKRNVWHRYAVLVVSFLIVAIIITFSVIWSYGNANKNTLHPNFTFGSDNVSEVKMSESELNDIINEYSELSLLKSVVGINIIYSGDGNDTSNDNTADSSKNQAGIPIEKGTVVMRVIRGEMETQNDYYFVNVRISYTDSFVFFDKWKYSELPESTCINGTKIDYEAKGMDTYGMYLYYALTQKENVTLYWSLSCIENLFDEWLQLTFG